MRRIARSTGAVGHELPQGRRRKREQLDVLERDDRRRPAVAEVAAPVDRRDLAEVSPGPSSFTSSSSTRTDSRPDSTM
jgi:hypothetical protein